MKAKEWKHHQYFVIQVAQVKQSPQVCLKVTIIKAGAQEMFLCHQMDILILTAFCFQEAFFQAQPMSLTIGGFLTPTADSNVSQIP